MKMGRLLETKQDWFAKAMHRWKELISMKHLHQLLEWKPSECFYPMHVQEKSKSTKWMLSQHF